MENSIKEYKTLDLKPSKEVEDFLAYQKYIQEMICSVYGIPKELIFEKKKTNWFKRLWKKITFQKH